MTKFREQTVIPQIIHPKINGEVLYPFGPPVYRTELDTKIVDMLIAEGQRTREQKDLDHRLNLTSKRKISATIQLSDKKDYNGGELVIQTGKTKKGSIGWPATSKQGTMIMFPSYVDHQVNKVVRGVRYSVVIWAYGPPWR